jgi:hypothetical protein
MHGIWRAGTPGKIRSRRSGVQKNLVLVTDDFIGRQRHGRSAAIHDHINAIAVNPLPRQVGTDIGAVLVVAEQHFDIEAAIAHFSRCQAHTGELRRATHIAISAGKIRQQRNLDSIGGLCLCALPGQATNAGANARAGRKGRATCYIHDSSSQNGSKPLRLREGYAFCKEGKAPRSNRLSGAL